MLGWIKELFFKDAEDNVTNADTGSKRLPFRFDVKCEASVKASLDVNRLIEQLVTLFDSNRKLSFNTNEYEGISDVIVQSDNILKKKGFTSFKEYLESTIRQCRSNKKRLKLKLYYIDLLSTYEPETAIRQFESIRDEYPDNAEAGLAIANALYKAGESEGAYREYRRVSNLKNIPSHYIEKAQLHIKLMKSEKHFLEEDYDTAKRYLNSATLLAEKNNFFNEVNFGYVQLFTVAVKQNDWHSAEKIAFKHFQLKRVSDANIMAAIFNCLIILEIKVTKLFPYEYYKEAMSNFENMASHNAVMLFNSFACYTVYETADKPDIQYAINLFDSVKACFKWTDTPLLDEAKYHLAELKTVLYDFKDAYSYLSEITHKDHGVTQTHEYYWLRNYLEIILSLPSGEEPHGVDSTDRLVQTPRGFQYFLLWALYSSIEKGIPPNGTICTVMKKNIDVYLFQSFELYEQAESFGNQKALAYYSHMIYLCSTINSLFSIFSGEFDDPYEYLLDIFERDVFYYEPIKNLQIAVTLTCLCEHKEVSGDRERVALRIDEYLKNIKLEDECGLLKPQIESLTKIIKKLKGVPFNVKNITDSLYKYPFDSLMPYYNFELNSQQK